MNVQIILAPNGERMVVLPESDFRSLVERADAAKELGNPRDIREVLAENIGAPPDPIAGDDPDRAFREYHAGASAEDEEGKPAEERATAASKGSPESAAAAELMNAWTDARTV